MKNLNYTCRAESFMKLLGKKWSLVILKKIIHDKETSFTSLKKDLRISQKILSERLQKLEEYGLVTKDHEKYFCNSLSSKVHNLISEIEALQ